MSAQAPQRIVCNAVQSRGVIGVIPSIGLTCRVLSGPSFLRRTSRLHVPGLRTCTGALSGCAVGFALAANLGVSVAVVTVIGVALYGVLPREILDVVSTPLQRHVAWGMR